MVTTLVRGAAPDCIIWLHSIAWLHTEDDSRAATPATPMQASAKQAAFNITPTVIAL